MGPLIERYAKGELKTVEDLKSEHKRVMKTLPPPTGVDTKKARVADTPPRAEEAAHRHPEEAAGGENEARRQWRLRFAAVDAARGVQA